MPPPPDCSAAPDMCNLVDDLKQKPTVHEYGFNDGTSIARAAKPAAPTVRLLSLS